MARFSNTYCSQCGEEFGPGDSGFSHCDQHLGMEEKMQVPADERTTLEQVMRQAEADMATAHAEICKLQDLDPAEHDWPEWSPQANTLRWFKAIREKFGIKA